MSLSLNETQWIRNSSSGQSRNIRRHTTFKGSLFFLRGGVFKSFSIRNWKLQSGKQSARRVRSYIERTNKQRKPLSKTVSFKGRRPQKDYLFDLVLMVAANLLVLPQPQRNDGAWRFHGQDFEIFDISSRLPARPTRDLLHCLELLLHLGCHRLATWLLPPLQPPPRHTCLELFNYVAQTALHRK